MSACVRIIPSTRHHQLDFDSVGHQNSQDLLVGDVLHTKMHIRMCSHATCGDTGLCSSLWNVCACMFVSYMVDEARLVSSCLSLPSRARPLFSRFLSSVGVRVYTLQKVELDDTWSLATRTNKHTHAQLNLKHLSDREFDPNLKSSSSDKIKLNAAFKLNLMYRTLTK